MRFILLEFLFIYLMDEYLLRLGEDLNLYEYKIQICPCKWIIVFNCYSTTLSMTHIYLHEE